MQGIEGGTILRDKNGVEARQRRPFAVDAFFSSFNGVNTAVPVVIGSSLETLS